LLIAVPSAVPSFRREGSRRTGETEKNDLYGRGHGRLDGESITAVSDNILKAYVSIVET